MEDKRTFEVVKDYWEDQGNKFGTDPRSTIKDHQFRLLEMETILDMLNSSDLAVDIGCGNGFSTLEYAKAVKEITGVDYSESLIAAANKLKEGHPSQSKTRFEVGDCRELKLPDGKFDVAIMERVLINLPTYEDQEKAALEAKRILKPGGKFILSEVTPQGHEKINTLRKQFGLEKIKVHWHNLYVDEEKFIPFLAQHFRILDIKRFGMYQFISKVIHPMIVAPEEPKFDAKINEIARKIGKSITNFRDASHQVTFVLEKK